MRHREAERDRTVRGDCRETDAAASVSAAGCEAGAVYSRRAVKRIASYHVSYRPAQALSLTRARR